MFYKIFTIFFLAHCFVANVSAEDIVGLLQGDRILSHSTAQEFTDLVKGLHVDTEKEYLQATLKVLGRKLHRDMAAVEEILASVEFLVNSSYAQKIGGIEKAAFDKLFKDYEALKDAYAKTDTFAAKFKREYSSADYIEHIKKKEQFMLGNKPDVSLSGYWAYLSDKLAGPYYAWNKEYQALRAFIKEERAGKNYKVINPLPYNKKKFYEAFRELQVLLRRLSPQDSPRF